jgi:hypothetical protein
VRKDGEVMLTCLPKSSPRKAPTYKHRDMLLRYDTFPIGYGFVGPEEPDDDGWFKGMLFKHMVEQWARLKGVGGMVHLDLDSVAPDGRPIDAEEMAEIKRWREECARRKQARQSGCSPRSGP